MTPRESAVIVVTSKTVTGIAIAFLVLAAFFGFLNSQKVKTLRTSAANAQAGRGAAERGAAKAEAELTQVQKEKADLQARLDASQQETAASQTHVEETGKAAAPTDGSPAAPVQTA